MLHFDNHAIQTLEKEKDLLERSIDGFTDVIRAINKVEFEERKKRLSQVNQAIETLKENPKPIIGYTNFKQPVK